MLMVATGLLDFVCWIAVSPAR